MTTMTMMHTSKAVSDLISSCVPAGVRGGHSGVELVALTAVLITMCRYATNRTVTTHQTTKTKGKITLRSGSRSGPKPEQC